ncbi:HNH endonuclease [Scytonema sp. NUACC26]|uniref:HNH endonuclease signature motif containing protein n=1 Tax=Scytonema sp. NUACC26 TaxID=3140176 RepID=UPI0034DBB200
MDIVDEIFPKGWYLGKLCVRGHNYKDTSFSLRNKGDICVECNYIYQKRYRESDKGREFRRRYEKLIVQKARAEKLQQIREEEERKKAVADVVPLGYFLGKICIHQHDYKSTGFSLRNKYGHCIECLRITKQRYKKSEKGKVARKRYDKSPVGKAKYARYNQGKGKEAKRAYVSKNVEWNRERSRRGTAVRRAKKVGNPCIPYKTEDVALLKFKFELCCAYCGKATQCQLDHFVPVCKGGADSIDNLIPACPSCNLSKNSQDASAWYRQQSFFTERRWEKIKDHVTGR